AEHRASGRGRAAPTGTDFTFASGGPQRDRHQTVLPASATASDRFPAQQIVERLAPTDDPEGVPRDEDLRRTPPRVVLAGHRHAVRARRPPDDQIASLEARP